jgi:hypothetical protein
VPLRIQVAIELAMSSARFGLYRLRCGSAHLRLCDNLQSGESVLKVAIACAATIPALILVTSDHAQTSSATQRLEAQLTEAQTVLLDWPNLSRYRDQNAKLPPASTSEERVVFMGDSITDAWGRERGTFFPGKPYVIAASVGRQLRKCSCASGRT